jgi:hypothetical protein
MKCPHCLEEFEDDRQEVDRWENIDGYWRTVRKFCPNCKKNIYHLRHHLLYDDENNLYNESQESFQKQMNNKNIQPQIFRDVPEPFLEDYKEAFMIFPISPKASAALSRRCLQQLIRTKGEVRKGNLAGEIKQVIDDSKLPQHLLESLEEVLNISNFNLCPVKSISPSEICEIEPVEAEWNLEVLEMLFDFYFVQPEKMRLKKETLHKKHRSEKESSK